MYIVNSIHVEEDSKWTVIALNLPKQEDSEAQRISFLIGNFVMYICNIME